MDWDAIQKRENKKAIEARKYGELLKQQNQEIKERLLYEYICIFAIQYIYKHILYVI